MHASNTWFSCYLVTQSDVLFSSIVLEYHWVGKAIGPVWKTVHFKWLLLLCRIAQFTLTIWLLTFWQGIIYYPYNRYWMEVSLMQAYCMKCRAKREMKDAKSITMKNGKPATQGVCPVCGTKMFRIGKSWSRCYNYWDFCGDEGVNLRPAKGGKRWCSLLKFQRTMTPLCEIQF